jgi:hypothetical protein
MQSLYLNCAQGWRQTYVKILKLSMGKRCGKRDLGWTRKVCVICPVVFLFNSCKIQGCLEDLLWLQVTLGQLCRGLRNSCTGSKSFLITNLRNLGQAKGDTKLFSIVCRFIAHLCIWTHGLPPSKICYWLLWPCTAWVPCLSLCVFLLCFNNMINGVITPPLQPEE